MKKQVFMLLGSMSLSMSTAAQNLTQQSVNKAQEVINQVVEAYGGAERLNGLNSMTVEFEATNLAVNQSRKPEPPWDENKVKGSSVIDFENQQFITRAKSLSDNQDFHNGTIINGEQSYQVDFRASTASPIAAPNFMNTAGPFIRVTPALLVKQLMQRTHTAHYLGQADVDGRPHDVVTMVMEVGPAISLYFDQQTHMLNQSERVLGAFGLVGYRFHDYQTVDGIPFNQGFELFINGDNNMQRKNLRTTVNQSVAQHAALPSGLRQVAAVQPDPVSRQEISDGVYLIGGNGTYAMFIEMDDHVIAVGGTAGIPERIALLKEVVTDKPIKYGVMTHHHSDHIVGAGPYADEGVEVIAAAAHEQVIRETADHDQLKISTVKKNRTFKSGDRTVEVIDIGPTNHTEHLLVAYLPKEGIVFQADHFGVRAPGDVAPANPTTQDFAAALKKHKIKAKSIVSAHSAIVATESDLNSALEQAKRLEKKS